MKLILALLFGLSTVHASNYIPDNSVTSTKIAQGSGHEIQNLSVANTASAGALTILVKDYLGNTPTAYSAPRTALRSSTLTSGLYNRRSVTSALSFTISSGTKLDYAANVAKDLYFYLIDSNGSGTMKIGASTARYDDTVLQSSVAESVTGTVTIASPGVWTSNGHGYANGDAVTFTTSGALPTGLTAGTVYYIISAAANSFNVSATSGGAAINTSGSQSGTHTIHPANGKLISDAVYANVAIRLIGRGSYNLATPGTWLVAASLSSGDFHLPPQLNKLIFTASGTFYAPAGTSTNTVYKITCIGGGGAGGTGGAGSTGGGGGGGGGAGIVNVSGIAYPSSTAVTVGTGGAGVASGGSSNPGNAGNSTSFGSLCVAGGGSGGLGTAAFVVGGAGGTASTGDLLVPGTAGTGGYNVPSLTNNGGTGGSTILGAGGKGGHGAVSAVAGTFGGGGGGTSSVSSAAGGDGLVMLEWNQ